MKHKIAVIFTIILVLGIAGIKSSPDKSHENNDISYVDGYCVISGSHIIKPHYPMLPYKVKSYIFPAGTKIKSIDVEEINVKKIGLKYKIKPAPQPSIGKKENVYEGSIYSKDEFYPSKWFDYKIGVGLKNGKHVLFLNIYLYPYRYNAVENKLLHAEDFNISIDYNLPEKTQKSISSYDLLIIAPDSWLNDLQPLVNEKEQHGIKTKLAGLSECLQMNGRDDAEKVKYFIKNAIEQWGIKYVMLVGSASKFPVRYSHAYDKEESQFVSDLYYADIYGSDGKFSSWDSNGDGVYGEYNYNGKTDSIDLYPDVYVGRLACATEKELTDVIDKIIEYENNPAGMDWTNHVVGFGGDTDDDNGNVYEGEKTKDTAFFNLGGRYNITKIYASNGDLSESRIIEEFSKGGILFNFAGHGNRLSWATHPPGDFDKWIGFDITDVHLFSNGNKMPVVILNACETGQFDKGTCLAWKLVGIGGKGAIASMATTGLSWGYDGSYCTNGLSGYMDVRLCRNFDKGMYAGDIFDESIENYLTWQMMNSVYDYKTVEEWLLFGDPTLKIGGYGNESNNPVVIIKNPEGGFLYINDKAVMPTNFKKALVIGKITVNVSGYNVNRVEFYVDNELKYTDDEPPYQWLWNGFAFGSHEIKVIGYGNKGKQAEDSVSVFIIQL